MEWIGYSPYAQFMQRLAVTNPGAKTLQSMQPQEFRVAKAAVPATNTPARASSTFVQHIRYLPNSQVAFVRLGGKQYWYAQTPTQLARWLNSRSLGGYYNQYVKLK